MRIAGLIGDCFENGTHLLEGKDSLSARINRDFGARQHDRIETQEERHARVNSQAERQQEARKTRRGIVDAFVGLYDQWCVSEKYPDQRWIWRVTKNRRVHLAVAKSALTVKADAARLAAAIADLDDVLGVFMDAQRRIGLELLSRTQHQINPGHVDGRLPGPGIPIPGIAKISLHRMKQTMNPGSRFRGNILRNVMGIVPAAFPGKPKRL